MDEVKKSAKSWVGALGEKRVEVKNFKNLEPTFKFSITETPICLDLNTLQKILRACL